MNRVLKNILLMACVSLAGCASSGVKISDEKIATLQDGKTTKTEVLASFGQPTSQHRNSDGTSTLIYSHSQTQARAITFVPIVGAFAGGADTTFGSVVLNFDKSGVLSSYSTSSDQHGVATGIAAGSVEQTQQPRQQN